MDGAAFYKVPNHEYRINVLTPITYEVAAGHDSDGIIADPSNLPPSNRMWMKQPDHISNLERKIIILNTLKVIQCY